MFCILFYVLLLGQLTDGAKFLRIPEAAARLGVGRTTLYRLIREGSIETVRVGAKARRVPVDSLDRYADGLAREHGLAG
jgi:excisionase family DNA binding protein